MHHPVLLKESLEYLNPKKGDVMVDATINGGGHAAEILRAIGETGMLIGIEQDSDILDKLKSKFWNNAVLVNDNFRNMDKVLQTLKIEKINGAIFDIGISSLQLEESGRGFSFRKNEPLLMTMKSLPETGTLTAMEIVNKYSEKELADLIWQYGEERFSRKIARNIVSRRRKKRIETTFELVDIIRESAPSFYRNNKRINCATRTFQALRIAVNDELSALEEGIKKSWTVLESGGRLAVISFHSLEDRIVKNIFKELAAKKEGVILTKKPVTPSLIERKANSRSRSAKLRAIEKTT